MTEFAAGAELLMETTRTDGRTGSLHQTIRRLVLERILTGEAGPGSSMSVTSLAAETGISRTPVREALLQLRTQGFLTLEENRGFFVAELTEREAREVYPILHVLEDLALVSGGRPAKAQLDDMEDINRRLERARDPDDAIALNFAWHRELTASCPNRELLSLLARYRMRVYRYERTYYEPGESRIAYSVRLHRETQDALRSGDMPRARNVLERHWVGDYSLYLPNHGMQAVTNPTGDIGETRDE